MPCRRWGNTIVCSPTINEAEISTLDCPTCKMPRPMLAEHADWYGWTVTCLTCGDVWCDGEMCERPFLRGWREDSIIAAMKRWESYRAEQASG